MAIKVTFENGNVRDYPEATEAQPVDGGAILRSAKGKEVAALGGPIVMIEIDGKEIPWPPA